MRTCIHRTITAIAIICGFVSVNTALVSAQEVVRFKRVSKVRPQIKVRCGMHEADKRYKAVHVLRNGRRLRLPLKAGRKALAVKDLAESNRFSLWSCEQSGLEGVDDQLIAKVNNESEVVMLPVEVEAFEKLPKAPEQGGNLKEQCPNIQSLPSSFIYKTVGSHHFTDCRRSTAGLILKAGVRGPFPSATQVVDTKGNLRAVLGQYTPSGHEWAYRAYACWGSGRNTPYSGSKIASDARKATGSSNVYLKLGNTCYGPIDAGRCYNSSSC